MKSALMKDRVILFGGNKNNEIQEYNLEHKVWRTLNYGFRSHIPVNDIEKFTCITEPLHVQFSKKKEESEKKETME